MQITARADYALRAVLALAASPDELVSAPTLAAQHRLPVKFLQAILNRLRKAGLVVSQRGTDGGYQLARPPGEITIGQVITAADGQPSPLTGRVDPPLPQLLPVWRATDAAVLSVVNEVTLADVLTGQTRHHIPT